MSDDPPPSPSPEPEPPSPEEIPALPSGARALRRRYKKPDPNEAVTAGEDSQEEIIILSSLLQNLLERKQSVQAAPVEGEARTKVNRFVARGGAAASTPEASQAPATEPGQTTGSETLPSPLPREEAPSPRQDANAAEAMASIAFPKFEPRNFAAEPNAWERSGSTWGRGILYFAFAAALALGAFLVGRSDAHRTDATAPDGRPESGLTDIWSPAYSDPLDKALAADHAGDISAALRIVNDLTKTMKPNPVLQAYRATLDTRLGHTNDVEADLSRLLEPITPPADAAVLNEAQGFNYARRREFDHAIEAFTAIIPVRPLDVSNLVHLAEAYRRRGRLTEAVDMFRLAILRLPVNHLPDTLARREFLSYEQRLTLVENGREAEFKDDLAQQLNAPSPPPEWLLTVAAVALQKGNMPTAVEDLKKAQVVLSPEQFTVRMGDYFFRSFSYHPEMNAFLTRLTPDQQKARQQSMDFYLDP